MTKFPFATAARSIECPALHNEFVRLSRNSPSRSAESLLQGLMRKRKAV